MKADSLNPAGKEYVPLHKIRAYVACGGTEWMLFIKQKFPVSKDSLSVLGIDSSHELAPYF